MAKHIILGGAGSGKTWNLIDRVVVETRKGIPLSRIAFVTFSKAAAEEARERLMRRFNCSKEDIPLCGTIHSICYKRYCADKKVIKEKHKVQFFKRFNIDYEVCRSDEDLITNERIMDVTGNMMLNFYDKLRMGLCIDIEDIKSKEELRKAFVSLNLQSMDFEKLFAGSFDLLKVLKAYQEFLNVNNLVDFPQMLLLAYKDKYIIDADVLICDEQQDLSPIQHYIYLLWSQNKKEVYIGGDSNQCLVEGTKILTSNGEKNIEDLKEGDEVISSFSSGKSCIQKVNKIKAREVDEEILKITTEDKKQILCTKNHHLFVNWDLSTKKGYYLYLMEDKELGFRIGITNNPVIRKRGEPCIEAIYPLKWIKTREEALFLEEYYSLKYCIPKRVFVWRQSLKDGNNKTLDMYNKKIFKSFNTRENIKKLLYELDKDLEISVWKKGGTYNRSQKKVINLCCLYYRGEGRNFIPSYMAYTQSGYDRKESQKNRKRFKSQSYSLARKKAEEWAVKYNAPILERWSFIEKSTYGKFLKIKAKNLLEGMNVPLFNKATNRFERGTIKQIQKIKRKTKVYDLEVSNTHNYIANGIVVSNCVYSFNLANAEYLLNEVKNIDKNNGDEVIILPKTYRMSEKINTHCSEYINKHLRKDKHVHATIEPMKAGGEIIEDEIDGNLNRIIDFIEPSKSTFILTRTNYYKKCIIEQVLIPNGIPYWEVRGQSIWSMRSINIFNTILKLIEGKQMNAEEVGIIFECIPFKLGLMKRGSKAAFKISKKKDTYSVSDLIAGGFNMSLYNFLTYEKIYDILDISDPVAIAFKAAKKEPIQTPINLKISTCHGAKGKEADNVIILKDVSKRIADEISKSIEAFESEIRVFYVGQSRAREKLIILRGAFSHADKYIIP